jgi:L-asparaginase
MENTSTKNDKGVMIIYTGGTIGCIPSDPNDPESPLVVAPWDEFSVQVPALQQLGKHFPIDAHSFKDPIDSTNMKPEYWQDMVEVIDKNYDKYNGFVILHGTDTMVYTASALSFMLENLEKPVIITGSQLPIVDRPRNDGEQNLMTSIMIANAPYYGLPVVPEVCIFFRDKLIRGNRSKKRSASGYAAFESPNYPVLGKAGEHNIVPKNCKRPCMVKKIYLKGYFSQIF